MTPLRPGGCLGIVGAQPLQAMLAEAAERLGYRVLIRESLDDAKPACDLVLDASGGLDDEMLERLNKRGYVVDLAHDDELCYALLCSRDHDGQTRCYDAAEVQFGQGRLDTVAAPARLQAERVGAMRDIAAEVCACLEVIGVITIYILPLRDDPLHLSNVVPHPDHTAFWAVLGSETDPFEQHVRVMCGLPLGPTNTLRPTALAFLPSDLWRLGEPRWDLAVDGRCVRLHRYGKSADRPSFAHALPLMGHLAAVGESTDEAYRTVVAARQALEPLA
jgi:5-(carboxyamino)imidazole ribonucleotide synthase